MSQRLHGMWATQSHRKLGIPYCYLLCGSVVQAVFIGTRLRAAGTKACGQVDIFGSSGTQQQE